MDWARDFLEELKSGGKAQGNFLGLLNVLIGRRIEKGDGAVVCSGLTWRQCAALLKKVRWNKEAIAELKLSPKSLPPRDREKFWYSAICQARVDSQEAARAGDSLAERLRKDGYIVGTTPSG